MRHKTVPEIARFALLSAFVVFARIGFFYTTLSINCNAKFAGGLPRQRGLLTGAIEILFCHGANEKLRPRLGQKFTANVIPQLRRSQ
jgi:hypothetical protein